MDKKEIQAAFCQRVNDIYMKLQATIIKIDIDKEY
jgi:hypothetical protein